MELTPALEEFTVTVVSADAVVLPLLASAVYVVVLVGFTVTVPPVLLSV
jgi:hypothetical protein